MPVVDTLLNSLIKYLQKKQKARKRKKKINRRRPAKVQRRPKKSAAKERFVPKRKGPKKKKKFRKPVSKRLAKKKPVKSVKKKKKKVSAKRPLKAVEKTDEVCIGTITHCFSRIQVVVVKMTRDQLRVGETVHICGKKTDFTQKVQSIQIESVDVKVARKGQLIGLKVGKHAKVGDKIYKPKA